MIYKALCDVRVEVLAFNESKKKFVHNLNMRPCNLEDRLVLFRVKRFPLWVHWWWYGTEKVLAEHVDNSWVHRLCNDLSIVCHVVKQLVES